MDKILFSTAFPWINDLAGKLSDIISKLSVTSASICKATGEMVVFVESSEIVTYRNIKKLQDILLKKLSTTGTVSSVEIVPCFDMPDIRPEEFLSLYRDSMDEELFDKSPVITGLIRKARISFFDNSCEIAIENNAVARLRQDEIVSFFQNVLNVRLKRNYSFAVTFYDSEENDDKRRAEELIYEKALERSVKRKSLAAEDRKSKDDPGGISASASASGASGVSKQSAASKSSSYDSSKYRAKKKTPDDPSVFYGRDVEGDAVKICDLVDSLDEIVIRGMIVKTEIKDFREDKKIVNISFTDFTDTIGATIFVKNESFDELNGKLKTNSFIKIKGIAGFDRYRHSLAITSVKGMSVIADFREKRVDKAPVKRVELHAHTMMSEMDSVVDTATFIKTAFKWGHSAVSITDHGVVMAFTEAAHAIDKKKLSEEDQKRFKNFKIIFGMEAYLVDDEPDRIEDSKGHVFEKGPDGKYSDEDLRHMPTYHAIILAKNTLGRINLYRLVSESHIKYFGGKGIGARPRVPKSLFKECREGLLLGSACEAGELYRAIVRGKPYEEIKRIADFYDYYEIQPCGNNAFMIDDEDYPDVESIRDIQNHNRKICELGEKNGKLVVATCDVHFLNPEDEVYRRIIMYSKGFKDADRQAPLYFRTTEEMLDEFAYLGSDKAYEVVVTNTNLISDMIDKISPVRPDKCPPVIEDSDKTLTQICYRKAHSMYGEELPDIVKNRLEKELNAIIKNGYAVMYIIAQKLVWKSVEDGYLVGSRGSVGSSFVATMAGITEVNPLPSHYYCKKCHYSEFDSDICKEYASKSGFDMPDKKCPVCGENLSKDGHNIPFETFLGFNGDKEPDIDLNFSAEYQSKAHDYTEVIFGKGQTFRAGTVGTVADKTAYGYVLKYNEEHDLAQRPDEVERISLGMVGVRRTTGQHPGGIIVLPVGEDINTFTPVNRPANDITSKTITTHFDYHSIDHNLLKLDILGHDDPTMIRCLEDLTGLDAKTIPFDDKNVISLFEDTSALGVSSEDLLGCPLGSLGLPELGTKFVIQMLVDTKPKCFSDMIRISGLSHGTNVWANNTQVLIANGTVTLENAICTRDDIMTYLISMGIESGKSFKIMEAVRKGKKLTPEFEELMRANNVPEWYIWSCNMIEYMFPKAHAAAYVMMAFRVAYFKVYYPLAYYASYFSIRAKAFNYEKMCFGREKLLQIYNSYKKRNDLSNKEKDELDDILLVNEMYCRGIEFAPIDIYTADSKYFKIVGNRLMPALNTIEGMGDNAAEAVMLAAKGGEYLSREDFKNRTKVSNSVIETMERLGLFGDLPESNQFSLFDLM